MSNDCEYSTKSSTAQKLGHESIAKVNSLLVDSSNWNLRVRRNYCCYWGSGSKTKIAVVGVVEVKQKQFCKIVFVVPEM